MRWVKYPGESRLAQVRHFRRVTSRTLVIFVLMQLSLLAGSASAWVQPQDATPKPPLIVRVEPVSAAPLTRIQVEGYRLGAGLDERKRAVFVQGSNEYESISSGGSYEAANLKEGIQSANIMVPESLQPGPCQLMFEVQGRRSRPIDFRINVAATAPVLAKVNPQTLRPTQTIWIDGSGFAASDEIQFIDSAGHKYGFEGGYGSSHANTIAIPLPKNMAVGEASLRLIEHRSGTEQQSNSLSFMIVRGPTPLAIYEDWLMPVAPGQWLDLIIASDEPLKGAERIEISFRQNEQFLITATRNASDWRIQIPPSLKPGMVTLETRTIANGQASDWSSPISYRLLEKPAAAKIYSLEIQPVRADVAFRQDGKIVAVVTLKAAEFPRVRLPADKLSPGGVEVLTRVWRGGVPTEWLFEHHGFDWPTTSVPDGMLTEGPFIPGIPLGPETPKTLAVYPGEKLVVQGTLPVESPEGIRVVLEKEEHPPIVLQAISAGNPRNAKVELPDSLDAGEWEVTVQSLDDGTSVTLPVKLRVLQSGGKRE